jgi:hypothetical protein
MPDDTIQIRTHFSFMQRAFRPYKPSITIDGDEPQSTEWGETSHPVDPGEHTVYIEVPYAMGKKVGKATATVQVGADPWV